MRHCEFKQQYDPDLDKYVRKHVYDETTYGEGLIDVFKSVGKKLFGETTKSIAKTAAKSAATKAATKTGEFAGKKAGDKIIELLNKNRKKVNPVIMEATVSASEPKKLTPNEVNNRVNQILSGGMLRRRNFI